MKTAGIIAEYNPFHKGHEYQIRYTKEKLKADYVIVAMSGDYVQRGTPALISKHTRTEMALRCGADLVLEMPVSISTASAEAFAMGGVSLLDSLGIVDILCFGSESGEISALKELAEILVEEPEEYKKLLKSFLSEGLTFPAARSQALTEYFKNPRNFSGDDFDGVLTPLLNEVTQILNTPNNILGIEYCKALLRLNSQIRPVTIRREGMGYHETTVPEGDLVSSSPDLQSSTDFFASATAIRSLIQNPGGVHSEAISDINNPVRNPDTKTANILSSQIPPDAFYVFKKALDSGEFLRKFSGLYSFLLPYERKCRKPFFLYGCFRGSRPADHKSAESSVVLFPICICFKNQRTDSDKDTEGIASYYIKYPHCTHSDSLCQGSWFPQGKQ